MTGDADTRMRLQRFLARSGVDSRRKCEAYIADGRVRVNGVVVREMGVQVDPLNDLVECDGVPVVLPHLNTTIALNKPAGIYTTMHEQKGRPCVADFVPVDTYPGLTHIGRLDRDTTGILLFTNDGELCHRLLHPSHHVWKEYYAQVKGHPSERELDRLRAGIHIRKGEREHDCAPAEVSVLSALPQGFRVQETCLEPGRANTSIVCIRIREGVKHQVKLMLGAIGHPVVNLHRTVFGNIACAGIALGQWRELTPDEVEGLRHEG